MWKPEGETYVSSVTLGEFLGITDERVRQLEEEGILTPKGKSRIRQYDLVPSVNAYIEYIKNTDKDIKKKMDEADLKYKEAKGAKMELELSELKGQMHRSEDVAVIVTDMIAKLRASILSVPGRIAVDCSEARTPVEAAAVIKAAVDEVLNETAEIKYNAADYRRLVAEREKWIRIHEEITEVRKTTPAKTKKAERQKTATEKSTPKKTTSRKQPASSKASAKTSRRRKT